MTCTTLICFFIITLTMSIMVVMLSVELLKKDGLPDVDPVHLICLEQTIFMVVMVAGLLILGG